MKLGIAIKEVAEAEEQLAEALLKVGERHRTDHDVYHLTRLLSRWSQGHLAALEPFATRYEQSVDTDEIGRESAGALSALREKTAELLGRRPQSGLLLLHDLRELHLQAARASLAWTVLGQGAQAAKDQQLLDCVTLCHPETLRTLRWTLTKAKESAPQVLTT
ncbi:MAG TPA: hypothetical protein VGL54_00460 [Solirubrobacteraceae bacterium]|jgi:hypothetical protein